MDDVMLRLKTATTNEHKATKRTPLARAMLHGTMTLKEYVEQLSSYASLHVTLEAAALRSPDVAYVLGPPKKAARLRADLAALGVSHAAPSAVGNAVARFGGFLESASAAEIVGVLYVFEGSALGAAILHPTIAESLGLSDIQTSYYRGEGANTMEAWRAFGDRVRTVLRDEGAVASAERAARAAFLAIREIFTAIRPEAPAVPALPRRTALAGSCRSPDGSAALALDGHAGIQQVTVVARHDGAAET